MTNKDDADLDARMIRTSVTLSRRAVTNARLARGLRAMNKYRCNGSGKIAFTNTGRVICPDCHEMVAVARNIAGDLVASLTGSPVYTIPVHNR